MPNFSFLAGLEVAEKFVVVVVVGKIHSLNGEDPQLICGGPNQF